MRSLRSPSLQGGEYVTDMILWIKKHVLHSDRGAPRWRPTYDGAVTFFHGTLLSRLAGHVAASRCR
jgi:hypothetical protein